jgi:hypothetical protein
MSGTVVLREKWPVLGPHEQAAVWLQIWTDLGRAPRTIDAYARGLADVDPVLANRVRIAVYVRELERILEPGQLTIRVNVHLVESSTFEMAPRRGASISSLM